MTYHKVFDPKGQMFEVPATKLKKLVVELGWTFWHPNNPKQVFKDT